MVSYKGVLCRGVKENEITAGINFTAENNVRLIGIGDEPKSFTFGDNVYIGEDVKIIGNRVTILDYTKVHNHTFIFAPFPITIGYNCWIGQNVILNAEAELKLGNNVCIAAYSQLWTHVKFGDTLEGCRFNSTKPMFIEDDVWIAGQCVVAPIHAGKKSMVLAGSVVLHDLMENRIYAGAPATDITHKIGPQFDEVSTETKLAKMKKHLEDFLAGLGSPPGHGIAVVSEYPEKPDPGKTYFNVADRTYTKRNTEMEHRFMNYLLPEKAKFIPFSGAR